MGLGVLQDSSGCLPVVSVAFRGGGSIAMWEHSGQDAAGCHSGVLL